MKSDYVILLLSRTVLSHPISISLSRNLRIKNIFLLLLWSLLIPISYAQSDFTKLGVGFNINQSHKDFGIGIDLVSPYFANGKMAVKVATNLKWLEHLEEGRMTWTPYQNVLMGIRGRQFVLEQKINIYGEGGLIIIFPNDKFSTSKTEIGGYGLFGFEFKTAENYGFYLELGGLGTGARADKVASEPIYSNGLLTNVGFRFII